MFLIEKNKPISARRNSGRPKKYPFSKMEIGDSIVVAGGPDEKRRALGAMRVYKVRTGKTFAWDVEHESGAHTLNEPIEIGIRIWRTA